MTLDFSNWKQVLKLAWPLILANSFWNIQLTIDRIYLGQFSTEALGASLTVMGIFWTPMALLQQTSAYITTFVAQYYGANKLDQIGKAVWHSVYFGIFGGLLFMLLPLVSKQLFFGVGHSEILQDLEIQYFNAICFSALPTALVATFSGYFTGLGSTRVVLLINFVGMLSNLILDYLLIFGNWGFPVLGIAGAGYATALANLISASLGLYLVFFKAQNPAHEIRRGWIWSRDLAQRYIKYGLPSGLQWALEGLAFTVFLALLGRFQNGDANLSASSIAMTLLMLAVLPAIGVGQAVMVLVGQHLGNNRSDEAQKVTYSGVQISFIYMSLAGLSFVLFPHFYTQFFAAENLNVEIWSQVEQMTPTLFIFVAYFCLFDSLNFNFSFALKGAGDTRFVSLLSLVLPWPFMVGPSFYIKDWDQAIFWAWGFAAFYASFLAMVLWWRFKGGKWKTMSVIRD